MGFSGIIFDLDGTLADTLQDLTSAINHARRAFGLGELPPEEVRGIVGDGARMLIARSFPEKCREEALPLFLGFYQQNLLVHTHAYPQIPQLLKSLAGLKISMGVVTNKSAEASRKILEGLGLASFFQSLLGGDDPAGRKPDPGPLWKTARNLGLNPPEVLVAGDGRNDILAAHAAGMAVCGVSYGFGRREELVKVGADFIVAQPLDIIALLPQGPKTPNR